MADTENVHQLEFVDVVEQVQAWLIPKMSTNLGLSWVVDKLKEALIKWLNAESVR